jgi:hypothetical protein
MKIEPVIHLLGMLRHTNTYRISCASLFDNRSGLNYITACLPLSVVPEKIEDNLRPGLT